ncbi:MAG: hypothetical protein ABI266_09255 [Ginsengibacter sp.]
MKTFILSVCTLLLFNTTLIAQKSETIRVKGAEAKLFFARGHYKYPSFNRSRIYFKNGEPASARVNYDYFTDNMQYIGEKNDTLMINNPADIDYISVGLDSFFYETKWYEWVASSATARIGQRVTYQLISSDVVGAYGTSSPAINVESKSALMYGSMLALDENKEFTFRKETTYYVSANDKNHFVLANAKNMGKLFSKKNISGYISEKKLDLNKTDDLMDVFVFANKP